MKREEREKKTDHQRKKIDRQIDRLLDIQILKFFNEKKDATSQYFSEYKRKYRNINIYTLHNRYVQADIQYIYGIFYASLSMTKIVLS